MFLVLGNFLSDSLVSEPKIISHHGSESILVNLEVMSDLVQDWRKFSFVECTHSSMYVFLKIRGSDFVIRNPVVNELHIERWRNEGAYHSLLMSESHDFLHFIFEQLQGWDGHLIYIGLCKQKFCQIDFPRDPLHIRLIKFVNDHHDVVWFLSTNFSVLELSFPDILGRSMNWELEIREVSLHNILNLDVCTLQRHDHIQQSHIEHGLSNLKILYLVQHVETCDEMSECLLHVWRVKVVIVSLHTSSESTLPITFCFTSLSFQFFLHVITP